MRVCVCVCECVSTWRILTKFLSDLDIFRPDRSPLPTITATQRNQHQSNTKGDKCVEKVVDPRTFNVEVPGVEKVVDPLVVPCRGARASRLRVRHRRPHCPTWVGLRHKKTQQQHRLQLQNHGERGAVTGLRAHGEVGGSGRCVDHSRPQIVPARCRGGGTSGPDPRRGCPCCRPARERGAR